MKIEFEDACVLCGKKADILSEEDDLYYCMSCYEEEFMCD